MSNFKPVTINTKHATNVSDIFVETVLSYRSLTDEILQLIQQIPTSSAEEIAASCNSIEENSKRLHALDEQIITILDIAGYELSHNELVYDYRTALAHASDAINELYQHLLTKKLDIQIDSIKALLRQ